MNSATDLVQANSSTELVQANSATDLVQANSATELVQANSATDLVQANSATDLVQANSATDLVQANSAADLVQANSATDLVQANSATDLVQANSAADLVQANSATELDQLDLALDQNAEAEPGAMDDQADATDANLHEILKTDYDVEGTDFVNTCADLNAQQIDEKDQNSVYLTELDDIVLSASLLLVDSMHQMDKNVKDKTYLSSNF